MVEEGLKAQEAAYAARGISVYGPVLTPKGERNDFRLVVALLAAYLVVSRARPSRR